MARKATISWVRIGTDDVTSTPVKYTGKCRASVLITYISNHCFLFGKQGRSTCEAKQVASSHFQTPVATSNKHEPAYLTTTKITSSD